MKKLLRVFLVLTMIFGITACSSKPADKKETKVEKTEKKNNTNLPQTGEQANIVISLIGIFITIEALLLRIFKKQQNNE